MEARRGSLHRQLGTTRVVSNGDRWFASSSKCMRRFSGGTWPKNSGSDLRTNTLLFWVELSFCCVLHFGNDLKVFQSAFGSGFGSLGQAVGPVSKFEFGWKGRSTKTLASFAIKGMAESGQCCVLM